MESILCQSNTSCVNPFRASSMPTNGLQNSKDATQIEQVLRLGYSEFWTYCFQCAEVCVLYKSHLCWRVMERQPLAILGTYPFMILFNRFGEPGCLSYQSEYVLRQQNTILAAIAAGISTHGTEFMPELTSLSQLVDMSHRKCSFQLLCCPSCTIWVDALLRYASVVDLLLAGYLL